MFTGKIKIHSLELAKNISLQKSFISIILNYCVLEGNMVT